jgi:tetratricopeptide (TPR) repeat protein
VFPYRAETADVLKDLMKDEDHWKLKYYLALIYWNNNRKEEARQLFQACGNEVTAEIFWLAKAKLFAGDTLMVLQSVKKAYELDPEDWRSALAYIQYGLDHHRVKDILPIARSFTEKYPENPLLGLNYARALMKMGHYGKSIRFLEKFKILPFEGREDGRILYRHVCILEGLKKMDKKEYSSALTLFRKAIQWPENLGAGKPYDVDNRPEDFLIAYLLEKSGENGKAVEWYNKVANYKNPSYWPEGSKLIFQLLALKKLGREKEARSLLRERLREYPRNPYVQWAEARFYGDTIRSRDIENSILHSHTITRRYDISYKEKDFQMMLDILERI